MLQIGDAAERGAHRLGDVAIDDLGARARIGGDDEDLWKADVRQQLLVEVESGEDPGSHHQDGNEDDHGSVGQAPADDCSHGQ